MTLRYAFLLTAILLAGTLPQTVAAQSTVPGLATPPPPPAPLENTVVPAAVVAPLPPIDDTVAFSHAERWIIPDYFVEVREQQLRASRSKKYKRDLPEGVTQPPAKGELVPAGVIADMRPLPGPLQRQLPPARPDTIRRIAGQDVLMLRQSTGEVLDILPGVIH